ncbi:MAG: hypothetical protein AAGE43_04095 [Pseudomonadota bacterium]
MTQALTDRSRKLLKAMGIEVYRLRHGDAAREPVEQAPDQTPVKQALKDTLPPLAGSETAPASAPPSASPAPMTVPADAGPAVAPFVVLCLRKAGGLVILEADATGGPRQKAERRFAVDLLAAATGAWGGDTEALVFSWPQAAIENTAVAQRKALRAFLAKQLSDAQATVVLMDEGLSARLPEDGAFFDGSADAGGADVLSVPPLTALMSDGALKRALWQTLERYGAE